MKLAFVSQPWAGVQPPTESVSIWNREVARLLAGEHDTAIYASAAAQPPGRLRADGVDYRFVSAAPDWRALKVLERLPRPGRAAPLFASRAYFAAYARRVARDLAREGADVVHVHNFSQFVPVIRRALPDALIALHMHCEWLTTLDRSLVRRRIEAADLVLGCSEHIAGGIRSAFRELVPRCHAVPNGVDIEAFSPRERFDRDGPPRLLTVGRVSPEKGFHVLVAALELLRSRGHEVLLEWVGPEAPVPLPMLVSLHREPVVRDLARFYDRPYARSVLASVDARTAAAVALRGELPHADMPEVYAGADVLVAPSLAEAFGMPLVEAMAAGLPVVASATGGIPEVVEDGLTGVLVPRDAPEELARGLARLAEDPGLRRSMGVAGRSRAQECFAWPRVAERVLECYASAEVHAA